MFVRPAFVIAAKDLRQRVRDRSAIVLAVIAPFALAAILGTLLPAEDEEATHIHRYAIVDQDNGLIGDSFETDVLANLDKNKSIEVVSVASPRRARDMAATDAVAAAFVIPEGFSDAATSNQDAVIEVVGNPQARIATQIAHSVAGVFVDELNAVRVAAATAASADGGVPDPRSIARLGRAASATVAPVTVEEDPAADRQLDSATFSAAGMAVFFVFFTAQFGVLSLLAERREGTLARLLAAPISPGVILLAKALSTFVFGFISMTTLVVASRMVLGAQWGNPFGVGLLILGGVVAAMGLTSLVGSFARTDEQAAGYSSIVAVTLGILGGTFFPVSQGPGLLSKLTLLTPHHWLMRGFGDLSGGVAGPIDILPSVTALLAFGLIVGALALLRARAMVLQR